MASPITDDRLQAIGSTLTKVVTGAPAFAGLALGPSAAIGCAAEMAFKFIRLGFAVNKATKEAAAGLDAAVRALDIPRERILVDLSDVVADEFARNGTFSGVYPEIAWQFDSEIEEVQSRPPALVRDVTRRRIAFAARFIPELAQNQEFDSMQLQDIFGKWLHPLEPDYHRLIAEMEQLLPEPEFSVNSHLNRRSAYFEQTLRLAGFQVEQRSALADEALQSTIQGLIFDTIFGDDGALSKTSGLLINLRKAHIDEETANYNTLKAGISDSDPDASTKRAAIDDRIGALTAWKGRLG